MIRFKKIGLAIAVIAINVGVLSISANRMKMVTLSSDDSVHDILAQLGEKEVKNLSANSLPNVSAEAGERMVLEGFSQDGNGKTYAKLGNHFVCTSCHNVVKENDDLTSIDPQQRLDYAKENNLLDQPGWARFKRIAKRQQKLF